MRAARERAVTFGAIAEEYLEKLRKEGRAPATLKKLDWLIGQTRPQLYDQPIRQIEAPDVLRQLRKIEANGTYETTRRLRSTISEQKTAMDLASNLRRQSPTLTVSL